jgi:integrase
MKGARKLSDSEIAPIASSFRGRYAVRDRALFILGLSTGGRISELLSLRIKDVWQYSTPVDTIYFRKSQTKVSCPFDHKP